MHIFQSLLAFLSYFVIGLAMIFCFLLVYTRITPHNEWQLIKRSNTSAAIAFSGSVLGYVIPLSSAAINAVSIPDYLLWGVIALIVQLIVYGGVRVYMPMLSEKIIGRDLAAGIFMGSSALAGGVFNAACMTW
jgi:putative membrane protein